MAILDEFTHLLAVSGGADSMAMLHMMRNQRGIMVAHVNHGLRCDAHMDGKLVEHFCLTNSIPFTSKTLTNPPHTGFEAWARDQRYAFFRDVMDQFGIGILATAHNANDQAETIIMRIIRGTGIKGLRGIHEMNPNLIRPIIHMTKSEVYEYCHVNNVPYREDYTNTDLSYFRNRVRHTMMDGIDIQRLCRISTLAEQVYPKIMKLADSIYAPHVQKTDSRIVVGASVCFDDLGYMYFSELFTDWFPLTDSIYRRMKSPDPSTRKFNITKSIICEKTTNRIIITRNNV